LSDTTEAEDCVGLLPLVLDATLDLSAAEPLCSALRERLDAGAVVIDGGAVERITTPCLQVLAATAREAAARGVAFRLVDASADLVAAVSELGLGALIPVEA
jgi:anti-anti-sigma regulatory factor